jgi:hypothetical protein
MTTPAREGLPELPADVKWLLESIVQYGSDTLREGTSDRTFYVEGVREMKRRAQFALDALASQPAQGGGEVPQDAVLWALGTRVPEEVRARYGYPVHYTVADYMAGDTDENMLVMRTVLESVAGQFPAPAALPHPQPERRESVAVIVGELTSFVAHIATSHSNRDGTVTLPPSVKSVAASLIERCDLSPLVYRTPPPPSDAAQGVQAVRVDEAMVERGAKALADEYDPHDYYEEMSEGQRDQWRTKARCVLIAAHKGEGNG